MKMKSLSIQLDEDIYTKVKEKSKEESRSISGQVRHFLSMIMTGQMVVKNEGKEKK